MKGADLVLKCLELQGVDTIFGVPGEENSDVMMSLLDSHIKFISCRHEQAAAFMADMYGRLTGRPGVCMATLGPGATNLLTGVASANMDYSPLVAIIGQASTHRLHKESHQNMDSVSMFKPVSKWVATVQTADNIPEIVSKAFKIAATEKQGACVIELPEDIAKEESDQAPIPPRYSRHHAGVEKHLVDNVLELIANSERPLILAGNGCVRSGAAGALRGFVEATGIYATTTFMGKGSVSDESELCLFCTGLGHKDIVIEAFEQADLLICIGYDMVEWHPDKWNVGRPKKIIHIDTTMAEVDSNYVVDIDMLCDIGETLKNLTKRVGPEHKKTAPEFAEIRKRIKKERDEHAGDCSFPMKPQKILSDLRAVMKRDDILISDVGAHKIWVARQYPTYEAGSCFISNGFCSMGIALPSSIAAKRLHPEKNVVALCGDGGFLMNVQDLATAVRYKTPVVVLIWDDSGYGLIEWKQMLNYCKTSHVDLENPDFVKLAEAFGCAGIKIECPDDLKPALEKAFATTDRPTVITVPVDYSQNVELSKRQGQFFCDI
ncbi:acetolactate synthase large subunit [bacterium]